MNGSDTYNFANLDILCVDNNRNMHKILKSILSSMRINLTRFCVDAPDAFTEMKERVPDIVITE